MAYNQRFTFSVLALGSSGWKNCGVSTEMKVAVSTAENLFATGQYTQVRVDQEYVDPTNKRQIKSTIMSRGTAKTASVSPTLIVAAVAVIGLISFGVTYVVIYAMN